MVSFDRSLILAITLAVVLVAPGAAAHTGLLHEAEGARGLAQLNALAFPETPHVTGLYPATGPLTFEASEAAGEYSLRFRCATPTDGEGGANPTAALACPYYILDEHDIMSQPRMVVDPYDSSLIAFHALHGGSGLHPVPDNQPPSDRSRMNSVHQPHTTFRTTDFGQGWQDMPYYAPDSLSNEREVFGEDNAITLDGEGRLYLASLYAHRPRGTETAPASGPFEYGVGLWKAHRINRPVDYHVNTKIVHAENEGSNLIDNLHATYVRDTNKVVVLWRESVREDALLDAVGSGPASFIQVVTTNPDDGAMWQAMDASNRIGPCRDITNPLVVGREIFIGCMPDQGYATPNGAAAGTLQIHAIDTAASIQRHVASTPIQEGKVLLVSRGAEGFMIAIASGLTGNGDASVKISYGEMGARWSSPEEFGKDLTSVADAPLLDARVTAAAFAPVSGNLHLIYMERYEVAEASQDRGEKPEFTKVFAAVRAEGSYQGRVDLGLGTVNRVQYAPTIQGFGTGAFNDLHDSIVIWTDPDTGKDREFAAFGDYGYVRFGEVIEENFPIPIPPLGTTVPPVPLATAGTNPAIYGAGAGILASAMVARLLLAKKKQTVEAPTE